MGIMDLIRGELIEVIEWLDDSRDTLSWRFPDDDREIKRGAQLIVREGQAAQFVYLGQYADLFGPGRHRLTTDNIPVLSTLRGWKYGFESPFKADVYFVSTRVFTGQKWGTSNPVMLRDPDLGIVRLRAFGTFDFRIVDVPRFLGEVAGTDHQVEIDEFAGTMRSRIVSAFSEALATSHVPALDIASRYRELGDALLPIINPVLRAKYGLGVSAFVVENVSVPPEVERALDARSGMAAVGNLNEYVQYQIARAAGTGDAGTAGVGAELAVGLGMARQFMAATGMAADGPAAASPGVIPDVLTPAEVAAALGVSEADVLASLEAGELKGRRIGSAWRVTRAQVNAFLAR